VQMLMEYDTAMREGQEHWKAKGLCFNFMLHGYCTDEMGAGCRFAHPWGSILPGDTGWEPLERGFCWIAFRGGECRIPGCKERRVHKPGPRAFFSNTFASRSTVRETMKANGWKDELIDRLHERRPEAKGPRGGPRRQGAYSNICHWYKQGKPGSCRHGAECKFVHVIVLGRGVTVPEGIRPQDCPKNLCYKHYTGQECNGMGQCGSHFKAGDRFVAPAGK
jgi:hypothetical protein